MNYFTDNKKTLELAGGIWDRVITTAFRIGEAVGQGTKIKNKIEFGDDVLYTEINEAIEKLRKYSVKSVKKFVELCLIDLDNLASNIESNYNYCESLKEKELAENDYNEVQNIKLRVESYGLEELAELADKTYQNLVKRVKTTYSRRKDVVAKLLNINSKTNKTQKDAESDTRLEGFKKILKNDDIME